jgi:hypothetical protein
MGYSRTTKSAKNGKPKPRLRGSADGSFLDKAIKSFSVFQDNPIADPTSPELGFCFVKTSLGVLQIDIGWLLLLIGGILDRKVSKRGKSVEIKVTEDVLDATLEVIRAIPRYIHRDMLGMFFEADGLVAFKAVENPRLRDIGIDKPYTVEKICKLLLVHGDKRETVDLRMLGALVSTGLPAFAVPEIEEAFVNAVSERGSVGTGPWRKFIRQHFREKRGRGRRSNQLYDDLFKKRMENPDLSYGKLAREVAKSKNIEFTIARDQLKAAIAYRRKKALNPKQVRIPEHA